MTVSHLTKRVLSVRWTASGNDRHEGALQPV